MSTSESSSPSSVVYLCGRGFNAALGCVKDKENPVVFWRARERNRLEMWFPGRNRSSSTFAAAEKHDDFVTLKVRPRCLFSCPEGFGEILF